MAKLAFISALLAAVACVEGTPFPPSATLKPAAQPTSPAYYGHKAGNYQPTTANVNATKTTSDLHARVLNAARAVGEYVSNSALARFDNSNINDGIGNGQDVYKMYWGAGRANEGWPTRSQWVSFENMFNNNKNIMFSSCSTWGVPNDSGPEVGAIWDSIQQVAGETGVDHRFILAVMIQESGGCVRVPTTNYGVRNPGLMQDHNGAGTCNENGNVQNPCPTGVITQMIREGTAGTSSGDGLANCINQAGTSADQAFYKAARIYNSGSIDSSTRLECGIATHCYASDIANRLTGWVYAAHGCNCDANFASCGC
ncbi:hypothetical protein BR93DRAFT_960804 [Coniochaeta sp. PMI_546]|nr:hypothetical protein BR93DRAFT_960804 [Coniochaeta sp. PMI_546]